MAPLFHADQVGSLIRPTSLLEARRSLALYSDEGSPAQLAATSHAIAEVVQKQLELNIRPITSGEFERTGFFSGFFEKLKGMRVETHLTMPDDFRTELPSARGLTKLGITTFPAVVAVDKIEHVTSAYLPGWEMFKAVVPRENWKDCKITMPSLNWQHLMLAEGKAYAPEVYSSSREYLSDLAAAFRKEVQILYDAGLRSIQVDDPHLTFFVDEKFRDGLRQDGVDPDELLDLYIWASNEAIKGRPADLRVGVHLCRGNMPGTPGFMEGPYDSIAERVFNKLDYDTFYLEFDDARSGNFECLKHLPQGNNVVLGLISTKVAELEDADVLESRVRDAARAIAEGQGRDVDDVLADSLAISPQCGFASLHSNRGVDTEERQWEKLTLLRDVATKIWKE